MTSITRSRLLVQAVSRIGRAAVAPRLGVPVATLEDWLAGRADIPELKVSTLLNLLDDLLEKTGEQYPSTPGKTPPQNRGGLQHAHRRTR